LEMTTHTHKKKKKKKKPTSWGDCMNPKLSCRMYYSE
jgi:hypothetical protein